MKLYTEEEIHRTFGLLLSEAFIKGLFGAMQPIELPSDEEIEEYANFAMPNAEKIGGETYTAYRGFKLGAKFIVDKIKGDKT